MFDQLHNYIQFNCSKKFNLPPEQGWDKKQTIQHLVAKAGYRWSKINIEDIQVTRYEGVKSKLTYEEYKDFMKSIEA